jgi:hypothetical protein
MENKTNDVTSEVENQVLNEDGTPIVAPEAIQVDPPVQPTQAEITASYLRENGIEFENIEDFKKSRQPVVEIKEVNPYEDQMDESDKAFYTYKKETGRGRKDFEALNTNLDELPRIDLARERVRQEAGIPLSNEEADEYITDTLGIDLDEMSVSDKVKLASYTKALLDTKKIEQEKFRSPSENKPENQNPETQNEYHRLPNGSVMKKADFETMENNRLQQIEKAKEALNSVTASSFKIVVDENGTNKELSFAYEYSEEDKHSMVSVVSDIDGAMTKRYSSEQGFNHKQFGEDMFWSDQQKREKAIASIVHKALAQRTEELMKEQGNFNFNPNAPLHKNGTSGKIVTFKEIYNR